MAITKAASGDHNISAADTEEALWTAGTISGDGIYRLMVKLTDLGDSDTVIIRITKKSSVSGDVAELVGFAKYEGAQGILVHESDDIILEDTDTIDATIEASNAADNFIFVLYKIDQS